MQLSNHCEGAICCLAPLLGTGGKRNTSSAMQTIVEMHYGFTSQHYQELTSSGYLLHVLAIHHKLTWCLHIPQSSCTLVELRGKGKKKITSFPHPSACFFAARDRTTPWAITPPTQDDTSPFCFNYWLALEQAQQQQQDLTWKTAGLQRPEQFFSYPPFLSTCRREENDGNWQVSSSSLASEWLTMHYNYVQQTETVLVHCKV